MIERFCEKIGIDHDAFLKLRLLVEQNGQFYDIHEVKKAFFYSPETGKLERAVIDNFKILFGTLGSALMPILDVTPEEYDDMINSM
ncbi:2270_t:CDS:2, partial [Acaulospora morrowiae]